MPRAEDESSHFYEDKKNFKIYHKFSSLKELGLKDKGVKGLIALLPPCPLAILPL